MKMFKLITILLFVLVMCTSAMADPACKAYTMIYEEDTYTLDFRCGTSLIGIVYALYNLDEYVQAWVYLFDGQTVIVPKLGYFDYTDEALYHIIYDYTIGVWYRTGFTFSRVYE